jgi:hypothetical protein
MVFSDQQKQEGDKGEDLNLSSADGYGTPDEDEEDVFKDAMEGLGNHVYINHMILGGHIVYFDSSTRFEVTGIPTPPAPEVSDITPSDCRPLTDNQRIIMERYFGISRNNRSFKMEEEVLRCNEHILYNDTYERLYRDIERKDLVDPYPYGEDYGRYDKPAITSWRALSARLRKNISELIKEDQSDVDNVVENIAKMNLATYVDALPQGGGNTHYMNSMYFYSMANVQSQQIIHPSRANPVYTLVLKTMTIRYAEEKGFEIKDLFHSHELYIHLFQDLYTSGLRAGNPKSNKLSKFLDYTGTWSCYSKGCKEKACLILSQLDEGETQMKQALKLASKCIFNSEMRGYIDAYLGESIEFGRLVEMIVASYTNAKKGLTGSPYFFLKIGPFLFWRIRNTLYLVNSDILTELLECVQDMQGTVCGFIKLELYREAEYYKRIHLSYLNGMMDFGGPEFNLAWGYVGMTSWRYRPHQGVIPSLLEKKDLSDKYIRAVAKGEGRQVPKSEIREDIRSRLGASLKPFMSILNMESNIGLTAICPGLVSLFRNFYSSMTLSYNFNTETGPGIREGVRTKHLCHYLFTQGRRLLERIKLSKDTKYEISRKELRQVWYIMWAEGALWPAVGSVLPSFRDFRKVGMEHMIPQYAAKLCCYAKVIPFTKEKEDEQE